MSVLNSDQWVLRRVYDIQGELAKIGVAHHAIQWYHGGPQCPQIVGLLNRRSKQLQDELIKYDQILADRDAALAERDEDIEELARIAQEEMKV